MPAKKVHDLATCRFIEAGESVIACGPVGTGKSHWLQAIAHAACRQGYKVLFTRASPMLARLGRGHADGTRESHFRTYLHPELLISDDFCLRELNPQQAEDTFELIGDQHGTPSTVIASNHAPQDWYPLFPNPVLADAALDPLTNRSRYLILEGRIYRPLLRPDRAHTCEGERPGVTSVRPAHQTWVNCLPAGRVNILTVDRTHDGGVCSIEKAGTKRGARWEPKMLCPAITGLAVSGLS